MVVPRDVSLPGRRTGLQTDARPGSGLEIAIPAGSPLKAEIWVNVPVEEPFANAHRK
jgi:hypothetical protein